MTTPLTWAEAAAGPLDGLECLWQDLDGVHLGAAPDTPPPTSILWAWEPDGDLVVRCRLDGDVVYLAQRRGLTGADLIPWSGHGRVAQVRANGNVDVLAVPLQLVREDITAAGGAPLTYLRRA